MHSSFFLTFSPPNFGFGLVMTMGSPTRCIIFALIAMLWVSLKASPLYKTQKFKELRCRITTHRTVSLLTHESSVKAFISVGQNSSNKRESSIRGDDNDLACIPLTRGADRDNLLFVQLPKHIVTVNHALIARGRLLVRLENVWVDSDRGGRVLLSRHSRVRVETPGGAYNERRMQESSQAMRTNGTQSIMIVRVSTADASPQMSLEDLEDSVFGSHHVSVASQYRDCSFGQLQFEKASSIDLMLSDYNISSFDDGSELLDVARTQLAVDLGVDSIDNVADRIIFCMAQTTSNGEDWVARSAINHYRVVINGNYCHYLHVKMHELGHAIGLYHAGIGQRQYADLSCTMGGTLPNGTLTTPQKCFNAYHHYQLGWFASNHLQFDPLEETMPQQVVLAAFTDYDKAQSAGGEAVVILNVANQYYMQYNRADRFNSETEAMADRVVINADLGDRTDLLAGLAVGEWFVVENYGDSGSTLIIKVCSRLEGNDSRPDSMILSISWNEDAC
jgi:Gametolysin peptidase M11